MKFVSISGFFILSVLGFLTIQSPIHVDASTAATVARSSLERTSVSLATRSNIAKSRSTASLTSSSRAEINQDLQRLFDVDGYNAGKGNECFLEDDTYDFFPNFGKDPANNAGDRGEWIKCLPPHLVVISQALKDDTEGLYEELQELYQVLKLWHINLCTHFYVDIADPMNDENTEKQQYTNLLKPVTEAILGVGDFTNNRLRSMFLRSFTREMKRYLRDVLKYDELSTCNLGTVQTEIDEDGDGEVEEVPNYLMRTMYFGGDGTVEANIKGLKYTYPKVAITGIRMGIEPVDNANSAQFQQCPLQGETEDRGAACLWIINEDQYKGLPDDQRDGFHNTQIHAGIAELFEEDIFKNRTRSGLRRKHFTDEPDDLSVFLLGEGKANRINNKDGFYIHAHMAFGGDAFLRVFSYQHVAERLYPGKVFKTCFCDFTKLAHVVEQTDCTYDYEANNGCGFGAGDQQVANDQGWFLDPADRNLETLVTSATGELLCCRNCNDNREGSNEDAPCKDKYDTTPVSA